MAFVPDSSEIAFEGPLFRVEVERWRGRRRDVVRHPGACGAVVFVEGERILLVRQMREAVRRPLLEIPAGLYDRKGESPEDAIRREVAEETGHRCTDVLPLGSILSSPGFSDERVDLFVCQAEPAGPHDDEEITEVVSVTFEEAIRLVLAGEIEDAKSCAALLLTRARRSKPEAGQTVS